MLASKLKLKHELWSYVKVTNWINYSSVTGIYYFL